MKSLFHLLEHAHAGLLSLICLVVRDDFLENRPELRVLVPTDQVRSDQFEIIFTLDYGLYYHVELFVVNFDPFQHLIQLLLMHYLTRFSFED